MMGESCSTRRPPFHRGRLSVRHTQATGKSDSGVRAPLLKSKKRRIVETGRAEPTIKARSYIGFVRA